MIVYAIILTQDDDTGKAWNRIKEKWPDSHHIVSNQLAFVSVSDGLTTANVSNVVGMNTEDKQLGLVIQISSHYFGYERKETWEWLEKNR